eukprot:9707-Prorocentrum_minimum.AAC.1
METKNNVFSFALFDLRHCSSLQELPSFLSAIDFDPHSLRKILPKGAAKLDRALEDGGRAYVHCTAGLGRSPAMGIAYLYWFKGMELDEAYEHLTRQRPCGPNRDAIRGATFDLVHGQPFDRFKEVRATQKPLPAPTKLDASSACST